MSNSYPALADNLTALVKKHYLNLIVRGLIYLVALTLTLVLFFSLLTYYFWPGTVVRTFEFITGLFLCLSFAIQFVVSPLFKFFLVKNNVDRAQVYQLVTLHLPKLLDKVTNTLELKNMSAQNENVDKTLIWSALEQNALNLNKVDLSGVISFKDNIRYLRFVFAPLVTLMVVLLIAPRALKDGLSHVYHFNTSYQKPPPFAFYLISSVVQNDFSCDLTLRLKGTKIPDKAFFVSNKSLIAMSNRTKGEFTTRLSPEYSASTILFFAGGVYSRPFSIKHAVSAHVSAIHLSLKNPHSATDRVYARAGEFSVLKGTKGKLSVTFSFEDSNTAKRSVTKVYRLLLDRDTFVKSHLREQAQISEEAEFDFHVMEDLPPQIEAHTSLDSMGELRHRRLIPFTISIQDDYGFRSLYVRITGRSNSKTNTKLFSILLPPGVTRWQGSFVYDAKDSPLLPGQSTEIAFEVTDNNAIKPAKSSSLSFFLRAESRGDSLAKSLKVIASLSKEASNLAQRQHELREGLLNLKSLSAEEKLTLKSTTAGQETLDNQLKELSHVEQELMHSGNSALADRIKKLIDSPASKSSLSAVEKLSPQQKAEALLEKLEKLNTGRKKELQNINMMYGKSASRQAETAKIAQLHSLAKAELKLSRAGSRSVADQKKIEEKFKSLLDLPGTSLLNRENHRAQQILKDFKDTQDKLRNERQNASLAQEKLSQSLDSFADEAEKAAEAGEEKENQQEIGSLRRLIENLLKISFKTEELIGFFAQLTSTDPAFREAQREHGALLVSLSLVGDSLNELAGKMPQIQPSVEKELMLATHHQQSVMKFLKSRNGAEASVEEQFAMTSINNLTVMLSNIKQVLQKSKTRTGKGQGKSMAELTALQDKLGRQIAGSGKSGEGSRLDQASLAKLAATQEAIRREMQLLSIGAKGASGAIKNMESNEREILYGNTAGFKERQKEILTRMLEAENAIKERELELKSTTGLNSARLEVIKPLTGKRVDSTGTSFVQIREGPTMKPFYRAKINSYFKHLSEGKLSHGK